MLAKRLIIILFKLQIFILIFFFISGIFGLIATILYPNAFSNPSRPPTLMGIGGIVGIYYGWLYSFKKTDWIINAYKKIIKSDFFISIKDFIKPQLSKLANNIFGERKIMVNSEEQLMHDFVRWFGTIGIICFALNLLIGEGPFLWKLLLLIVFTLLFVLASGTGFEKSDNKNYDEEVNKELKNWSIKDTLLNTPIGRLIRGIKGKETVDEIFNPIKNKVDKLYKSNTDVSSGKKHENEQKKSSVGLTEEKKKKLQELKLSLDNGLISKEVWEDEVKKVMNS